MRAVPAVVQAPVEAETPYGGRSATWTAVATVWVELHRSAPAAAAAAADTPPERTERAEARARTHPALAPGVRLDTGEGPPWTVTALRADAPVPGRCVLLLDRLL